LLFSGLAEMDRSIERIERLNVLLVGVGAIVGWETGLLHVPSVVLGGAVMGVNFWLLKKVVRGLLSRPGGRAKVRALFWLVGKAAFVLFLLSALFFRFSIQGPSFVVGVSLLLLACMIVSLRKSSAD
jgi:hypothetical protein